MCAARQFVAIVIVGCIFTSTSCSALADESAEAIHFQDTIAPLLKTHCVGCHGAELQEGDLRLDSLAGINNGGKSGLAIEPGQPDESLLIAAIRRTDALLQMPPDEKLPDDAVKALTEWIHNGARHPDGRIVGKSDVVPFDIEESRKYWAFQSVQTPDVPDVDRQEDVATPIDAFVVSKLQELHLQPNGIADKLTLLRRATFDLTGLPPTSQEIHEFIADDSPEAFAGVIDRLLASPQYGERWGRHWLDVVRYADSNGLDENIAHGNAWRYRNYVIQSLNADKPYDEFVREQIAGDLLIDESTDETTRNDRLIATGFLSMGPKVLAEGDEVKLQMDILDEQIDTLGRSMLGLTLGCARCHDHKFDPISHSDYYALTGIFQSTRTMESLKRIARWNENSVATSSDKSARENHQAKIDAKKQEIDDRLKSHLAEAAPSTGTTASAGVIVPSQISESQLPDESKNALALLREELKSLESTLPELPTAMGVSDGEVVNARILVRGNHLSPGREVARGVPVVLASTGFAAPANQSGRKEFAEWLTDPANPLTARVIVNRIWRWHFGRGLVTTADNFGKLGGRPSHPELLDWLASEFVRNGWSMKWLHRQILLSRTWQLTDDGNVNAEQHDPENALYWRWTPQRLSAESVRDSVLAVTGRLDRSMGTSMLHVKNREFLFDHTSKDLTSYDSYRRSVYLPVIRNNLYDAMSLFDCTDGTVPNGDRSSSTVASQSLFLMNSDLVISAAEHLAKELLAEFPEDATARIRSLFVRCLGRHVTEAELAEFHRAAASLRSQFIGNGESDARVDHEVWSSLSQTLLMSNEFLYVK